MPPMPEWTHRDIVMVSVGRVLVNIHYYMIKWMNSLLLPNVSSGVERVITRAQAPPLANIIALQTSVAFSHRIRNIAENIYHPLNPGEVGKCVHPSLLQAGRTDQKPQARNVHNLPPFRYYREVESTLIRLDFFSFLDALRPFSGLPPIFSSSPLGSWWQRLPERSI